jgi:hypothetical protein
VTASGAIALDGTQTAVLVDITAASNPGGFYFDQSNNGLIIGETYCASVFFKIISAAAGATMQYGMGGENAVCLIDFDTMTVTPTQPNALNPLVYPVGNGWYRLSCAGNATQTSGITILYISVGSAFEISFWGSQIEPGLSPTSYIPTTSAPVSRAADVIYGV